MHRKVFITLLIVLLSTSLLTAQWETNPRHWIYVGGGQEPVIAPDGSGGVFIVAQLGMSHVYAMAVDRYGNLRWDDWLLVGVDSITSRTPMISCPGNGILYISHNANFRDGNDSLRSEAWIQQIDTAGNRRWGDGIRIEQAYHLENIVARPQGDAFITWHSYYDDENGDRWKRKNVMRINAEGEFLWDEPSITEFRGDHGEQIVVDSTGLIFSGAYRFYKIGNDGEHVWDERGVLLGDDEDPLPNWSFSIEQRMPDGESGCVFMYRRYCRSRYLYGAQRIDSDGNFHWGDNSRGIILSDTISERPYGQHFAKADSGFYFLWDNHFQGIQYRIQSVNIEGQILWGEFGLNANADSTHAMGGARFVASGSDAILIWRDWHIQDSVAIFAQKFNPDGDRFWDEYGVPLLITVNDVFEFWTCTDNNGGAIWYANAPIGQINRNGEIGVVLPLSVDDSPFLPEQLSYSIFPNPTNNSANLYFTSPINGEMTLKFYDIQGRLILNDFINQGALTHPLNISEFPSGSYILQLQSGATESIRTLNVIK